VSRPDKIVSIGSVFAVAVALSLFVGHTTAEARRGVTIPPYCLSYGHWDPFPGCLFLVGDTAAYIAEDFVCDPAKLFIDCVTCRRASLSETCDFSTVPGWELQPS
jgi:hypothetical protein